MAVICRRRGKGEADADDATNPNSIDELHFHVTIRACPRCSQRFVSIFTETIDWADGDDSQYIVMLPITPDEAAELIRQNGDLSEATLNALGTHRRSLHYDHPTGAAPCTYWSTGIQVGMTRLSTPIHHERRVSTHSPSNGSRTDGGARSRPMSEKYPRMPHLPWSPGVTSDDRIIESLDALLGAPLIFTEKMDGSNVCLEREQVFARSHTESPRHESFDALKALHAGLRFVIPSEWQLFGEWLWARHSIAYDRLPAYLLLFGIRDQSQREWLSWAEQEEWAGAHGFRLVPVLWRGVCPTEEALRSTVLAHTNRPAFSQEQEGLVVRVSGSIPSGDFARRVAKWVRPSHVQTDTHWSTQKIVRNMLLSPPG